MTPQEMKALKVALALRYGCSDPCCKACRYGSTDGPWWCDKGNHQRNRKDVCEMFEPRRSSDPVRVFNFEPKILKIKKMFSEWDLSDILEEESGQ